MHLTRTPNHSHDGSKSKTNSGDIEIIGVSGLPLIEPGDKLTDMILEVVERNQQTITKGDIVVVAHTVVSIAEGKIVQSANVIVSPKAEKTALLTGQKPQKIQTALNEASDIIREDPVLITRTKHGIITDMSGIDESNAPLGHYVLLPENPDRSANQISATLTERLGFEVPVLIADTQGRPWRRGAVNIAIGLSGMSPFTENEGVRDLYGRELRSSLVCIADELAAAAELVMGQANEGIPVAIIRGIRWVDSTKTAKDILRVDSENLF